MDKITYPSGWEYELMEVEGRAVEMREVGELGIRGFELAGVIPAQGADRNSVLIFKRPVKFTVAPAVPED